MTPLQTKKAMRNHGDNLLSPRKIRILTIVSSVVFFLTGLVGEFPEKRVVGIAMGTGIVLFWCARKIRSGTAMSWVISACYVISYPLMERFAPGGIVSFFQLVALLNLFSGAFLWVGWLAEDHWEHDTKRLP
jgi:hypothetical protein